MRSEIPCEIQSPEELPLSRRAYLKRRDFLWLSVTSLLAACGPEAMGETAPSTRTGNTPTATATVTPLATATETATPSPTPATAGCGVSAVSEFEYGLETVLEDYLPGCEVSIATLSPGSNVAALLQAAGTLPDIYIGSQVNPQALSFAFADLSDLVEELVGEFGALNPHCEREIFVDGAAYAVPFHAWGKGAWVRRDLFEESGLDLDSIRTYEQLREQCLALSLSAGLPAWGMTVAYDYFGGYLVSRVLHGFGAQWAGDDGWEVTIASAAAEEAVAWLADTYTNPDFAPMLPPDSLVRTNQENREAFRREEVAYIQSGTDFYARLREEQPELAERTTYHRPVGGRAIEEFNGLSSTFCLIARESPNLDPARQLVLSLFQSDLLPQIFQTYTPTILPTYRSMWESDVLLEDPIVRAQMPVALDPAGWNGLAWPAPTTPLMQAVLDRQLHVQMARHVIEGAMTPAEAVEWAQAQSEELRASF